MEENLLETTIKMVNHPISDYQLRLVEVFVGLAIYALGIYVLRNLKKIKQPSGMIGMDME